MKRRFETKIAIVAVCIATQVLAETPTPYPAFTFKRIGPPPKGSTNRITIQIGPEDKLNPVVVPVKEPKPDKTAETALTDKPAALTGMEWYWLAVSPKLTDAGPDRLNNAVLHLAKAPVGNAVPTPRSKQLQDIAQAHGTDILKATIGTKVSPALVLAVIGIESNGNRKAVSGAGATGLMQLMPATAKRFGVEDSTIAAQNIKGGVAYLDWLMKKYNNDPVLVLAGYNAGEGAVKKHDGVPPFAETRAYVPKVLAAWTVARGLCQTPPEQITDGCVFTVKRLASGG